MSALPLPLTFVSDLHTLDRTRRHYANDVATGVNFRVARGVYAASVQWQTLADTDRYIALIHAIAHTRKSVPILSHWSAAALHGLPMIGRWPDTVHLTVFPSSGARSRNQITRHSLQLAADEIVEIAGLRVTSLTRTLVDLAALGHFVRAVTMVDRALHVSRLGTQSPWCTSEQLIRQWQRRLPFTGCARAREIIDFGVTQSDSALESLSRANMERIGFPRPQLQVPFYDHRGLIGYVDYFWPSHSLIGEADGDEKYLNPEFRGTQTVDEVMVAQLKRENRLRAIGFSVTRWDWAIANSLPRLKGHLTAAGLPARSH